MIYDLLITEVARWNKKFFADQFKHVLQRPFSLTTDGRRVEILYAGIVLFSEFEAEASSLTMPEINKIIHDKMKLIQNDCELFLKDEGS